MGLTLHYSLAAPTMTAVEARAVVTKLQRKAFDLPFAEVSEIVEYKGDACRRFSGESEVDKWIKTHAVQVVGKRLPSGGVGGLLVPPRVIIAFMVRPAEGCEPTSFGLCRYSPAIAIDGGRVRLETGLNGSLWSSCCYTQNALYPNCDGVPNFLKCHLGFISLLDHAKELGVLKDVVDEGGYWIKRDVPSLIYEISQWNAMLAGFYGKIKDAIEAAGHDSSSFVSEIAKFPNFERLQAERRRENKDE